jgi:hypothetical protein
MESKLPVYSFISSSISSIYGCSDRAKGLSNTDIAFSQSTPICLFCVCRLKLIFRRVFFSAAFDSIHAALMLLSLSNSMLILILSSNNAGEGFVLFVPNVKVLSEGVAMSDQMMDGTPFPPFLVATFVSSR